MMNIEIKQIKKERTCISVFALVNGEEVEYKLTGYERMQFREKDLKYFGNRPYYEDSFYKDIFNDFSALVYAGTGICFSDYLLNPKKGEEIRKKLRFLEVCAENCRRARVLYEALKFDLKTDKEDI